jgi:hypothetical protein
MDETVYTFPTDSLLQIEIKANEVSEVYTTSRVLIVHGNINKVLNNI